MKLTQKQKLFADEYIKSGNATDAYVKAGYKCSRSTARRNGNRLLTNADIKSYISIKTAEIESHKIADAKEVLQFYTRVLRKEETEQTTVLQKDGSEELVEMEPPLKERITAAKELMKRYPLGDPMAKAQLKKLNADARVAEARAKAMEDNGQDVEVLLDKMLETVTKEDKKNESK